MNVSRKCQYALRAVFELAKRHGEGPTTIGTVAEAQAIPVRFLELILAELRSGGFVESRRGVRGGYLLSSRPTSLTAGEIIQFIDGPVAPVPCVSREDDRDCPLRGRCAFLDMWRRAGDAMAEVYDQTTFADLIEQEASHQGPYVADYCI